MLRHEAYLSRVGDLSYSESVVWNTANGRPFEMSFVSVSYLGQHFSPALILFVPGYALWPDVRSLLFQQAIVISLGAVPVFLMARRELGTPALTNVAALCALLNPYNLFLALDDMHFDVLALPSVGFALYALRWGHRRLLIAAVAVTLLIREDYGLAVAGLGLYAIIGRRQPRLGVALLVGGIAYTTTMAALIIPTIGGHSYLYGDVNPEFGSGPLGVLWGMATHPIEATRFLLGSPRPEYALWLLGPYLFLPLLRSSRLLAALPLFGRNLVAAHPSRVWISSHYSTALSPAIPFAFVGALARLPPRVAMRLATACLASTLAWDVYGLGALVGTEIPTGPPPDAAAYRAALALIPPHVSVAATPRLGAQLAARPEFFEFPREYLSVTERPHLKPPQGADWAIIDLAFNPSGSGLTPERMEELVRASFPPERYVETFRSGAVVVLREQPGATSTLTGVSPHSETGTQHPDR